MVLNLLYEAKLVLLESSPSNKSLKTALRFEAISKITQKTLKFDHYSFQSNPNSIKIAIFGYFGLDTNYSNKLN